jgi:hypothetical protein
MDRRELILAALAASGGAVHSPTQVQKLLFLLDKKIAAHTGGPHFNFTPRDYGPFDESIPDELNKLEADRFVEINRVPQWSSKSYRCTPAGRIQGEKLLERLDTSVASYTRRLSEWVMSLSPGELLAAVYREYPEMQVNSVFRG